MIELLQLGRRHGYGPAASGDRSRRWQLGCTDAAAVRHLMAATELVRSAARAAVDVGSWLSRYERPLPMMHDYDQLLVGSTARRCAR